jgi:hypothetical protein
VGESALSQSSMHPISCSATCLPPKSAHHQPKLLLVVGKLRRSSEAMPLRSESRDRATGGREPQAMPIRRREKPGDRITNRQCAFGVKCEHCWLVRANPQAYSFPKLGLLTRVISPPVRNLALQCGDWEAIAVIPVISRLG